MPITFTCECGKKFQAKGEHAGRRAICPSCRRQITFPVQGGPEPEPAPEPTVFTSIPTEDGKPKPPAQTDATRPFWKDPIVVGGGVVPTVILLVFFGGRKGVRNRYVVLGPPVGTKRQFPASQQRFLTAFS
jgi:hypothetical protein